HQAVEQRGLAGAKKASQHRQGDRLSRTKGRAWRVHRAGAVVVVLSFAGLGVGFTAVAGFLGAAVVALGVPGAAAGACEVRWSTGRGRARGIGTSPARFDVAAKVDGGVLASELGLRFDQGPAAFAGLLTTFARAVGFVFGPRFAMSVPGL